MDKSDDILNRVVKNTDCETPELFLYGDILNRGEECVTAADVAEFLKDAGGKDINLYINSQGGSVFEGFTIYGMLKRYAGKITAYTDGVAASIASVILFAADEIIMPENAYIMVHEPYASVCGTAAEMRERADLLERLCADAVRIYTERAKVEPEEVLKAVKAETWLNGRQAAQMFKNVTLAPAVKAAAYAKTDFYEYKAIKEKLEKLKGKEF